eukprot:TRINITY_DN1477_c1_g1_i3.p1 TRINITY_DN1477_c1_g1~~TRINITY_DN1477_c1_g1_i3.p1  ORF type:complete len:182 (-),score=35.03 TRINITY_DN1477_c1_g1_i3:30-575(-)
MDEEGGWQTVSYVKKSTDKQQKPSKDKEKHPKGKYNHDTKTKQRETKPIVQTKKPPLQLEEPFTYILPLEITVYIINLLDLKSLVLFSQTSQIIHDICMNDRLWKPLFMKDFGTRKAHGRKKRNLPAEGEYAKRYIQLYLDEERVSEMRERRELFMKKTGSLSAPLEWFAKSKKKEGLLMF